MGHAWKTHNWNECVKDGLSEPLPKPHPDFGRHLTPQCLLRFRFAQTSLLYYSPSIDHHQISVFWSKLHPWSQTPINWPHQTMTDISILIEVTPLILNPHQLTTSDISILIDVTPLIPNPHQLTPSDSDADISILIEVTPLIPNPHQLTPSDISILIDVTPLIPAP